MNTPESSSEKAYSDEELVYRTPEDTARIKAAEEKLKLLVQRAETTVKMALENDFIPELDGARLNKFLDKVIEEANSPDMADRNTDEAVSFLETLCDKVKLPGDIKAENYEKLLAETGQDSVKKIIEKLGDMQLPEDEDAEKYN